MSLTFIKESPERRGGHIMWVCRCDCGKECTAAASAVRSGKTKSCGCLQRKLARNLGLSNTRHGYASHTKSHKTLTYNSWKSMLDRCHGTWRGKHTENYRLRGIIVCERWLTFDNFLADMGERPSRQHTLDRYPNNDGNYEPGNCRWATWKEQNNNRRPPKIRKENPSRRQLARRLRALAKSSSEAQP